MPVMQGETGYVLAVRGRGGDQMLLLRSRTAVQQPKTQGDSPNCPTAITTRRLPSHLLWIEPAADLSLGGGGPPPKVCWASDEAESASLAHSGDADSGQQPCGLY